MSTYKLVCPHCRKSVRIRTSVGVHIFLRETFLQCTNEACGWTARGQHEITHELSASGMPNQAVRLPLAPSALRRTVMSSTEGEFQKDMFDECAEPATSAEAPPGA